MVCVPTNQLEYQPIKGLESNCQFGYLRPLSLSLTHTHTHTYIYIYIYITHTNWIKQCINGV